MKIGDYSELPLVDYDRPPQFTWKDFYNFRNHVLRVLRQFGTAGPMGEVGLSADSDDEPQFKDDHVDDPDFFVVDDMYNEHNKISVVECEPTAIRPGLLHALNEMLHEFPDWWISFSLGDSGLKVSSGTILVGGRRFWDCGSPQELEERCSKPVDFGSAEEISDSMYRLWLKVVGGGIDSDFVFPKAQSRQWAEAIDSLVRVRGWKPNRPLNSMDYEWIRDDLHPSIRVQAMARFREEIDAIPPELISSSIGNLEKDAGIVLAHMSENEQIRSYCKEIATLLDAIVGRVDSRETAYWWAGVIRATEKPSEAARKTLEAEMRRGLAHPRSKVKLASVFGLANLQVADIASVVDSVLSSNPHWAENAEFSKWLGTLRAGHKVYPSRTMAMPVN